MRLDRQNQASMISDDDDGVDQQFKVVDDYYFEDDEEPVCFSILPFQFNDNDDVPDCGFKKNVYMRGRGDKMDEIYMWVVAWRIEFESKQPNILMLSGGNWIKLLKPRKCYAEKVSRSTLITLQMLHFIRKRPGVTRNSLFDHLNKAFSKFAFKPTMGDLSKQYSLVKLFTEKDRVLKSSKILQMFLADGYFKIEPNLETVSAKAQFIVNDESHETNYDDYGDHDDKAYNHGDSEEDDDDSHHEDDSDDDASSDGHSDNDDGADPLCAMCDDGGKLLSCKGQCKRAFHPTKKHGRRSECETLGYTSAQRKRIATYICKNCKYKQHQCFRCGELEPSDEPNAKVFQCNNSSCGYFYHPKCIAQLLEPGTVDGACALEKKISARMSFTCPIHWCFKCNRMEDRTQEALQFAACRRCPKSYHRQCLPRDISFETKDQGATYAWELPQIKFFYCLDHVDKATKTVTRDHIKFPPIPGIRRTRDPATKRVKRTVKRKHSMRSTELSNRSRAASERIVLATVSAAKHSKEDMQFKPCMSSVQGVEVQEKPSGTTSSVGRIQMSTSYVVDSDMEKRATSAAEKEATSETSWDVSRKGTVPCTRSMFDHSVQPGLKDANGQSKIDKHTSPPSFPFRRCSHTVQKVKEKTGMHSDLCAEESTSCVNQQQDIILETLLTDKDADWDNENSRMSGSLNTSEHHGSGKERDKPNKDTSCGNGEQNDVFDSLAEERVTEVDASNLQSGKVDGMEWEESACGHDPLSQQDGGAINLEVYSTYANHKEPDAMETELNSPRYSDDNRAAEISEDISKERTVSNTRVDLVHDMRGNSYKSHLQRNALEMPTHLSPEQRMMSYCDSYPINSYRYRYEQRCHVNCSCIDYFTCRKHRPLLDENGNLVYGGYHAMNVDPVFQCSPQHNSNTAFQPCADIRMEGHMAVYGACNSEYEMRSDGLFGRVPWAPAAMSVPVNYATHQEAHLAWRQTYNHARGWPILSHTNG